MKHKAILLSLFFCLGLMPIMTSCGDDELEDINGGGGTTSEATLRKMLIGTWKITEQNGYEEYTFKEDGTFEYVFFMNGDKETDNGTYTYFPSEKRIDLLYSNGNNNTIIITSITNNELITSDCVYMHVDGPTIEESNEEDNTGEDNNRGAVANTFRGTGTQSNPYIISDATELRKLADDVNGGKTYRDEYFKMTADITINQNVLTADGELNGTGEGFETWIPIGGTTPFCGTFDGNGHTISGIYINNDIESGSGKYALFGSLAGTLKNIKLKDSYIKGYTAAGFVSTMETFSSGSTTYTPSVTKLINYATVIGRSAGGIVVNQLGGEIDKCVNKGYIAGGIAVGISSPVYAHPSSIVRIKNSANYGKIEFQQQYFIDGQVPGFNSGAYGIECRVYGAYIYNCVNFGMVYCGLETVECRCTGIAHSKSYVRNCVNYGRLIGKCIVMVIGAVGDGIGSVDKCYYLETSRVNNGGNSVSFSCEADFDNKSISMTENQMISQSFLNTLNSNVKSLGTDYSNWKFGKDGFPTLDWIEEE